MVDYPGSHGRKRAIALHAADAGELVKAKLPFVFQAMTPAQIGQVQKVLDAAVVDPVVDREYDDAMRKSITAQIGTGRDVQTNRDPRLVNRAQKIRDERIDVVESDKHIKLDFVKLVTANALQPTTDNPDEVAYLLAIRNTLAARGVYLRIELELVRDPEDPSRRMYDQRTFQAWLCLGYDGDGIPTKDGRLTREALLGTTVLGANYYLRVSHGKIETALEKAIKLVENKISEGETLHEMERQARGDAAPLVVPVSDFLGGASFPSKTIWKQPNDLVLAALKQNVGGNVKQSSKTIVYAAIATGIAAELLDHYIDDTTTGAGRAVKILTVVKIAGKIAEVVMLVRAVIGGMIRLLATEAAETSGGAAAAKAVAKNRSPAAYAQTNYARVEAYERTIDNARVTLETGGGALDRYELATQQRIIGWNTDFTNGMKELYKAKGRTWASMEELEEVAKAVDAKWGNPLAFLD